MGFNSGFKGLTPHYIWVLSRYYPPIYAQIYADKLETSTGLRETLKKLIKWQTAWYRVNIFPWNKGRISVRLLGNITQIRYKLFLFSCGNRTLTGECRKLYTGSSTPVVHRATTRKNSRWVKHVGTVGEIRTACNLFAVTPELKGLVGS